MSFLDRIEPHTWENIVISLALLLVFLLIRTFAARWITRSRAIPSEHKRRWLVNTRTLLLVIFLLLLGTVWASELGAFTLSIAAFTVAIVLAVKELILCVSGTALRAHSRSFSVGDRIEINSMRGDVIDQSFLSTTILEIGPGQLSNQYTGRAVTLPNSVFLTAHVVNESFTEEYVLHLFTVPIWAGANWKKAEAALLTAATEECIHFLPQARQHMEKLVTKLGLDVPSLEPRVSISLPEPSRINLVVRVAVPARRKGRVEQAIIRRFLNAFPLSSAPS